MLKNIFSAYLDKEKARLIIRLFGIRVSLPSRKAKIKKLERLYDQLNGRLVIAEYSAYHTTRGNMFLYSNLEKFTEKEKIWYISQRFYEELGYFPNLRTPKTFNEKINWLKLYYDNPLLPVCIDKYTFKEYISKKIGAEYVVPLLGVYESVDDIDFDKLPDRFVLKTNNACSGKYGIKIVKDKKYIDIDRIKYDFNNWLQDWNAVYFYTLSRGYKEISPKIIAEQYIEQENGQLYDYKFFCFNGELKFIEVCSDRYSKDGLDLNFFDVNWNKLKLYMKPFRHSNTTFEKPSKLKEMIEIARKLSADFPMLRVDFYVLKDKIYVGELTFFPSSGFGGFCYEDDLALGKYLDLTKLNKRSKK